jgi:L-threonylcarbamoyladenylate synthase
VDPDNPDAAVLADAAATLRAGGLVAFATETVYGLGADATNAAAVARIFEAKGRPSFNPLIVHADGIGMARSCVADWPDLAATLAERFWPGPLTLVLRRSAGIPDVVTAGRDTVGVRVPLPAVTRALIAAVGRPLAAPSANRSSGVSPTMAAHVWDDLEGRVDLILDSGPTALGLESTVLDLSSALPRVLRPGPISARALSDALGGITVADTGAVVDEARPSSPGQLSVHYAPRARAVRVERARDLPNVAGSARAALLIVGQHSVPELSGFPHRITLETPSKAAKELYRVVRDCDRIGVEQIVVLVPPDTPEWRAVRDRLWRATVALVPGMN